MHWQTRRGNFPAATEHYIEEETLTKQAEAGTNKHKTVAFPDNISVLADKMTTPSASLGVLATLPIFEQPPVAACLKELDPHDYMIRGLKYFNPSFT